MLYILKFVPVLICSVLLGRWFLSEVKKAKLSGLSWTTPYFSIPGFLIIIALLSPIIVYFIN